MVITSLGESTKEKELLADGDFNGPYAIFWEPDSSKMAFSAAVNLAIPTLVLRLTKYLQKVWKSACRLTTAMLF